MMILIISKLAGCKVAGKLKIRGNEVLISESGILFGIPQNGILPSIIMICTSTKLLGPLIQRFCFRIVKCDKVRHPQ
jgi:hypothetical protein